MNPCLLLAHLLPVASTIAKLHVSRKSITMAAKLFASDSQLSASALDLLVPHNFNGKQSYVESIGGEESSAANDCVKLFACAAFTSLHLDPDGYLSGTFVFAQQDGSHPHGFSALSSGETIVHQHPLFLHCTAMHSTQHGNGATGISKCSEFFKTPNLINHVLFYPCMVRKYLRISQ